MVYSTGYEINMQFHWITRIQNFNRLFTYRIKENSRTLKLNIKLQLRFSQVDSNTTEKKSYNLSYAVLSKFNISYEWALNL
jgi:hypothetical protein